MKNEMKYLAAIAVIFVAVAGVFVWQNYESAPEIIESGELTKFGSESELIDFLENSENYGLDFSFRAETASVAGGAVPSPTFAESADASGKSTSVTSSAKDYSSTNIQVEGVDEPDIVKNDGEYIYTVSGKKVVILDAFPALEMKVLSEIDFEDYVYNIFLEEDKLIVMLNNYEYFEAGVDCVYSDVAIRAPCGGYSREQTVVKVYDVSDRSSPELENEFSMAGSLTEARLTNGLVYLISTKYIDLNNFEMPYYVSDGVERKILAEEIYYPGDSSGNYVFNIMSAIDINSGEINSEVFLLGSSHTIYVSENNIYLTTQKFVSQEESVERYAREVAIPVLPAREAEEVEEILESDEKLYVKSREINEIIVDYADSIEGRDKVEFLERFSELREEHNRKISEENDRTVVHRISFDDLDFDYEGNGEVPGRVLNQFSMDEFDGNFRIATTSGGFWGEGSLNNLYVLDENLEIAGSVEDLAPGERIYSTRFLGDRAYMVTFRQVDPLYVIDLTSPENPEVLGYLKITGYSSYLHPYDENHLIGVGMEADESGRVRGVKISLFDVSDVANPKEVGKYEVKEGMWSHSDALYEHKAFLFDREKEILVIPVSYSTQSEYWQGAYVLNINLEGINLKGKIAHERAEEVDYWSRGNDYVRRALYIDDMLYTISQKTVKASSLENVSEINSVELPFDEEHYPYYRFDTSVAA